MRGFNMFLKSQKLEFRLFIPIVAIVGIFSAFLYCGVNEIIGNLIDKTLTEKADAKIYDINRAEKIIQDQLLELASFFVCDKRIIDAYKVALTGDINKDYDEKVAKGRQIIRDAVKDIQTGYKRFFDDKKLSIHFHLPSVRSFLRIWEKDQNISDNIKPFRNTISQISRQPHTPIKGIEVGHGGFSIRGIVPIYDESKHYLGSVEALSSYEPIVKGTVSGTDETIAVFMNIQYLDYAVSLRDPAKNPIIDDKLVFVSSTDKHLTDKILSADMILSATNIRRTFDSGDYRITLFPINDYSDMQIGVMAYIYNAQGFYKQMRTAKTIVLGASFLFLLGIVVLISIIVLSVTKPLNSVIVNLNTKANQTAESSEKIVDSSIELAKSTNDLVDSLNAEPSSSKKINSTINQVSKTAFDTETITEGQTQNKQ